MNESKRWIGRGFLSGYDNSPRASVVEVSVIECGDNPLVEGQDGSRFRAYSPLFPDQTQASAWAASQLREIIEKINAKVEELESA